MRVVELPLAEHQSRSRSPAIKARRVRSSDSEMSTESSVRDTGLEESNDEDMEEADEVPIATHSARGKHDLTLNYSSSFNTYAFIHVGERKMPVIKYVGKGVNLRCDNSDPQVAIQTPSAKSQEHLRKFFPLPRFNARKFEAIADFQEVSLKNVDVHQLYADFCLRHRHLVRGDLSIKEKGQLVKQVPKLNESTEYQRALYAMTVQLCANDRNKAVAILFSFARVVEPNIRRKLSILGC